ncbi:triphosphoribosyl-dephospho-CoA synthase MdcB [Enterococcus durans]|uniref:triphosphoribosyl-dephospho-CoA synthase MdcB n=1 Tax=Enterococcus durans TaxID=53345 RepID=UPI003CEACE68
MREKQREMVAAQIAYSVEKALIAEVELSPKPGLVDAHSTGAHHDMDLSLFLRSAKSLTPFFKQMAIVSWNHPIDQELREKIAEIGRQAEKAMLKATNGVNTHKGAIWVMGLLSSVISQKISGNESLDYPQLFETVGKLAAFPDSKFQTKQKSHGLVVKKKYGVNGAYEEAVLGYPNLAHALTSYESFSTDSKEQKQLHMLLVLMSTIEDTCVLHRSDETTLFKMQKLAYDASKRLLPNPSFSELLRFCQKKQISPGGSADLLAAGIFLVEVKSWEKKPRKRSCSRSTLVKHISIQFVIKITPKS